MTDSKAYSDLIVKTFRERAIRTAMLIDDRFPTYDDLIAEGGGAAEYFQKDQARIVFKTFKDHKIPCDVENNPDNLFGDRFEHVRKSDFIVLDYHLRRDDDAYDATRVLRQLSDSKHFNLVVLYTAAPNLHGVWLEIATCLRGGWKRAEDIFGDDDVNRDIWEGLVSKSEFPQPSNDCLRSYILTGKCENEAKAWVELFKSNSIENNAIGRCIEATFHRHARVRFGDQRMVPFMDAPGKEIFGRCNNGLPLWILCGGVFIAITSKRNPTEAERSNRDPEGIIKCLDDALIDWQPNVLQLIISELQNILEQEPLPYDSNLIEDKVTQAGWIYHVLKQASASESDSEFSFQALEELYDRLFGAIQSNVSSSQALVDFGSKAFRTITESAVLHGKSEGELVDLAIEIAKIVVKKPQQGDVLHSLNKYLSSEPFTGSHVTTGTIFKHSDKNEWWVCASPACDMVPRKPSDHLGWSTLMHPMRPMTALRLENSKMAALETAEQGRTLFVKHEGQPLFLKAFEENTRQPRPHLFLLCDFNKLQPPAPNAVITFKAFYILSDTTSDSPKFEGHTFVAVAQLRPAYANRILQQTGNHTSRIGVDFVNFGKVRTT